MTQPKTTCPDCRTELEPIKLIDATGRNFSEGIGRVDLAYGAREQRCGIVFGITPKGYVEGYICPECKRILLYGHPLEPPKDVPLRPLGG